MRSFTHSNENVPILMEVHLYIVSLCVRMNDTEKSCFGTFSHSLEQFECHISRILGSIIVIVASFSTLFNIRFLYWSTVHGKNRSHHNLFIVSMIFSSTMVILVMTPSILLQSFTCTRFCSLFYCRLEGFVSFLSGCVHMFKLMMISIIRYVTILRGSSKQGYLRRNSNITIILSWLLGLLFALPPLFNLNQYIPEGFGFHCGLDWFDKSIASYLYLFSTMIFVYFVPLIILLVFNIHVYRIIRRLVTRASLMHGFSHVSEHFLDFPAQEIRDPGYKSGRSETRESLKYMNPSTIAMHKMIIHDRRMTARRSLNHTILRQSMHLNRLKADQKFALATIFLVGEYLLSWTPYACVALFYLFHMEFVTKTPLIVTFCAFIAKLSMIINPFIYIVAIKPKELRTILFCDVWYCSNCRRERISF